MDIPIDRAERPQGEPAQREAGLADELVLEAPAPADPIDLRGAGAAA